MYAHIQSFLLICINIKPIFLFYSSLSVPGFYENMRYLLGLVSSNSNRTKAWLLAMAMVMVMTWSAHNITLRKNTKIQFIRNLFLECTYTLRRGTPNRNSKFKYVKVFLNLPFFEIPFIHFSIFQFLCNFSK